MTIKEAKKLKSNFVLKGVIISALKLGIKVDLFDEENNIYYFKHNNRGRYFRSTSSTFNTSLSCMIAADKRLTQMALQNSGIKTANGYLINSELDLKLLINNKKLKFPIVIKPNKLMGGAGVFVNIRNINDSIKAIKNIKKIDKAKKEKILVEKYFHGQDYRLFVFPCGY